MMRGRMDELLALFRNGWGMDYELRCPECGSGPFLTPFETFEAANTFTQDFAPTNCHSCERSIEPAIAVVPDSS